VPRYVIEGDAKRKLKPLAPELVQVLSKVNLPLSLINQNLARMSKERISSQKLALEFFKQHPDIWKQWVSEDAAKKIEASL